MAGGGQSLGPTPWWQTGTNGANLENLQRSAPSGYTYDPVQMRYTPIVGSVSDQLRQQQERERTAEQQRSQQQAMLALQQQQQQERDRSQNAFNNQQYSLNSAREGRASQAWMIQQDLIRRLGDSMDTSSSSSSSSGQTVPVTGLNLSGGGSGGAAEIPQQAFVPDPQIDTAATSAQDAAFGKAKATAGSLGRSALESLRSEFASRGILGGGSEGRGVMAKLAESVNPLSDINAQALHENVGIAGHNQDLRQNAANIGYQGAITQRGQNMTAAANDAQLRQQANIFNANSQNQSRSQSQSSNQSGLVAALNGLSRLY